MTAAATARPVSAELPRSAHTSLAGGRSTWPDFIQKTRFSYCQTRDPARPTPTAAAIDDLDHLVGLLWHLDAAQRQLVWARACNVSWATLVTRMGRSRTNLCLCHASAPDGAALDGIQSWWSAPCQLSPDARGHP